MTDLPFADYEQPGRPTAGPRLAIVGEAPGAEEARLGRPFVGPSGRLLDETLVAAGMARADCLIANVFRYQPPGNKVAHFFASRTRARKEGRELDERWGPFGTSDRVLAEFSGEVIHLRDTLVAFGPKVVLALGRTPTWALTGRNGILQLRGTVLPCRLLQGVLEGVEVVPTYHPSYVLRGQLAEQPTFLADVRLAVSRLRA